MAKKKKQSLKPVNRGYTITSIPKKIETPSPSKVEEPVENLTIQDESKPKSTADLGPQLDTSLLLRFDKLQEKTGRDIIRSLKTISTEQNEASQLPRIFLDPLTIQSIFDLALKSDLPQKATSWSKTDDKFLAKLGLTYGVLRRMGFSEEMVFECLRSINSVELNDARDWLTLYHPTVEPGKQASISDVVYSPLLPETQVERAPSVPIISAYDSITPTQSKIQVSAEPPTHIPSDSDSDVNDELEDDPTKLHTLLKLKLTYFLRASSRDESTRTINHIKQKITALEKDPLFDAREADRKYRQRVKDLDTKKLHDKLRGELSRPNQPAQSETQPKSLDEPVKPLGVEDEDDYLDGIGELWDNVIEQDGVTVSVREFAIPKSAASRLPKTLLSDLIRKLDRHAVIDYSCESGESRAKRVALEIRWMVRRPDRWSMKDIACRQIEQAENYIATIALHSLTYPMLEGFPRDPTPTSTPYRNLPPSFREVWNDLENKRQLEDSERTYAVWLQLNKILESKIPTNLKVESKTLDRNLTSARTRRQIQPQAESLINTFYERQGSIAYQTMLVHRNTLPIARYRQGIINTLNYSQVLVLSGETGCGKSTQVPAFILEQCLSEGRPCRIICTEPRRISAISLAQRVSKELGEPPSLVGSPSSLIGYAIRLENKVSRNNRLVYATTGIALRMLEGGTSVEREEDFAFDEITHIIIDEVHERTIESDFLLIVLKSLLAERPDIKVVLMSATMEAEKISTYFNNCPMLHVPGRTFPVDAYYLEDVIETSGWTISENSVYAQKTHFQGKNLTWIEDVIGVDDDEVEKASPGLQFHLEKRLSSAAISTLKILDERVIPYDLILLLLEKICYDNASYTPFSPAILIFMPGIAEIRRLHDILTTHPKFGIPEAYLIYPLHSALASEEQSAVFDIPPPGTRKIVIATNIAETGITIPDITCVIDSGKHKEMRFDEKRQLSRLVECYIARSNASQRRGRAGRVQPGLCFHLFTKARFDTQMAETPLPEMMRLSLSDLALRIKIMRVDLGASIEEILSRALDPPSAINIQRAVSTLVETHALTPAEKLTPMGRLLSKMPTDVHLGKFLLMATIFRCLDPALTIAASLNTKGPFARPFGLEQEADRARLVFKSDNSDFLTIHNAFSSWKQSVIKHKAPKQYCQAHFLSYQNLQQIEELRQQFLSYLLDSGFIRKDPSLAHELKRTRTNRNRVCFVTVPVEYNENADKIPLINAALTAGLYPKILFIDSRTSEMKTLNNSAVHFHPSSVNYARNPREFGVSYLNYFTLMRSKRLYAWETGPVDNIPLVLLCGDTEFKINSNTIIVDRKVKYNAEPKVNLALKTLQMEFGSILEQYFSGGGLSDIQQVWYDLALSILSKGKVPLPGEAQS